MGKVDGAAPVGAHGSGRCVEPMLGPTRRNPRKALPSRTQRSRRPAGIRSGAGRGGYAAGVDGACRAIDQGRACRSRAGPRHRVCRRAPAGARGVQRGTPPGVVVRRRNRCAGWAGAGSVRHGRSSTRRYKVHGTKSVPAPLPIAPDRCPAPTSSPFSYGVRRRRRRAPCIPGSTPQPADRADALDRFRRSDVRSLTILKSELDRRHAPARCG